MINSLDFIHRFLGQTFKQFGLSALCYRYIDSAFQTPAELGMEDISPDMHTGKNV